MTDADLCRKNGWGPGTVLVAEAGKKFRECLSITAVGADRVMGRCVGYLAGENFSVPAESWQGSELVHPLPEEYRWRPVSPAELADLRAAGADLPPEPPAPPPADDGEPVTAGWLRSVGFADPPPEAETEALRLEIPAADRPGALWVWDDGGWVVCSDREMARGDYGFGGFTALTTRRRVRLLFAALGVSAKE